MYARDIDWDGKKLEITLAVSGMLWNRSLVMVDAPTESLWSHILGKAMRGPLEGTRLKPIPSHMTDWKTWRTKHPNTTVLMLPRTSRQFSRRIYRNPERFVLGFARGSDVRAWPYDELHRMPIVNDKVGELPVLVVFASESSTALLFDRRVEGRTLSFRFQDGELIDEQTNSTWDPQTGRAAAGILRGKSLELLPGIVSFRDVWKHFHPNIEEYAKQ